MADVGELHGTSGGTILSDASSANFNVGRDFAFDASDVQSYLAEGVEALSAGKPLLHGTNTYFSIAQGDIATVASFFLSGDPVGPGLFGGGSAVRIFLMRGWNTVALTYEPWVSIGSPSTSPPSGQPNIGITAKVVRPKDLVRV